MDRREFLEGSTAAVVTLGLSPWLIAGSPSLDSGALGKADFEALLHSWFHVGAPLTGWHSVELVAVRDDGTNARTEQFTLVFRGAPALELAEDTYTVSPPLGDEFDLFLQPMGGDASGATFAARFSLLRPLAPSCAAPA